MEADETDSGQKRAGGRSDREPLRDDSVSPGWDVLSANMNEQFQASLARARPAFEFVRMVITTALVVGLASYVTESGDKGLVVYAAITALWILALALSLMTVETALRFSALFGVAIAARLKLPYWRRTIHVLLAATTISMLLAIFAIGSQEFRKVTDRPRVPNVEKAR